MLYRTNVKEIGDPFVMWDGNHYYMYTTTFDLCGFRVRKSDDLINWEDLGLGLDLTNSKWASKDFWAPEVVYYNNKYIMHFTSRRKNDKSLRMGVAISNKPEGPFKEVNDEPLFDFGYASIDGHVFIDDDGKKYFYFSRDCSENINYKGEHISEICICELNDNLTQVITTPKVLFGPSEEYDSKSSFKEKWNEGPFMLKKDGIYYLSYSANFFGSKEYCVCLAKADNPYGPFKKADKPILTYKDVENDFSGPGHNMYFKDKDGNLMTAFHIHTFEDNPSGNRKACICNAKIEDGTIKFDL